MLNALYWLSIALVVGLVSLGGIAIYIGIMVAVIAKYAAEALCRRKPLKLVNPEKLRHVTLELFKSSLCITLELAIRSRCPMSDSTLDETFYCSAPSYIFDPLPDVGVPKEVYLMLDIESDDLQKQRLPFYLEFQRMERDGQVLWCIYKAVCPRGG